MSIKTVIKKVCLDKGMTLGDLANIHGLEPHSFYVKLCRNAMKYNEVIQIMDELGCDIQFKDRETGRIYD